MLVLEKPESVFFCAPTIITLQAGIFERFVKPPAAPKYVRITMIRFDWLLHFTAQTRYNVKYLEWFCLKMF